MDGRQTRSMARNDTRAPDEIRLQRKREVALGYRILAAQRWGDLGDGHISARDPERNDCFWMLRYGPSYHTATLEDLVLVGCREFSVQPTRRCGAGARGAETRAS